MQWFAFGPKQKGQAVSEVDFFEIWAKFTRDFTELWTEEQKRRARERFEAAKLAKKRILSEAMRPRCFCWEGRTRRSNVLRQ